ncbi:MAG: DUF3052 domain-containing protein [Chloroflexota bacterium]
MPAAKKDTPSTKPLLDKLGVKAGMRVALIDVDDANFSKELRQRTDLLFKTPKGVDIVFFGVDGANDMMRLAKLKDGIARNGAVWVIFRKGRTDFNENHIRDIGLESGLVDVKVVRFSDTHSAFKFVIRKADR